MVLSKRERYIAIGVLATVVVLGFYHFMLSPYLADRRQIATDLTQADQQTTDASILFSKQRRLKKIWAEMQDGGLKVDASQAESQTLQALLDWAAGAGVSLDALRPEHSTQERKFEVISFNVSGKGSVRSISKLLWALETATIPVRVNEMQITPKREGTDDLSVRLSVSSLCMPPEAAAKIVSASPVTGDHQ